MQDGCKVYMDSYVASNGSCFIVIWTTFKCHLLMVRFDPKLSEDGREIPKCQGSGWRFNFPAVKSPLYLTENLPCGQLPPVFWRCHVNNRSQKDNKYHLLEVGLTQYRKIMALRTLITVGLF
jgi:hypothetical protein